MPKQLSLPPGEMLLLTIDRVVDDVKCSNCLGTGIQRRDVIDFNGYHRRHKGETCYACKGMRKRRVRVRGWCKPEWYAEIIEAKPPSKYTHLPQVTAKIGSLSVVWVWGDDLITGKAIDAIISAHFAKTLPDGVAHIEEADE